MRVNDVLSRLNDSNQFYVHVVTGQQIIFLKFTKSGHSLLTRPQKSESQDVIYY